MALPDPSSSAFWIEFLKGMLKPALATAVVLMAVVLSFFQKLNLEGEMVYAIVRAFLQLSIIGFVLEFIFTQKNSAWIILAYLFMVSHACSSLTALRFLGFWFDDFDFLCIIYLLV